LDATLRKLADKPTDQFKSMLSAWSKVSVIDENEEKVIREGVSVEGKFFTYMAIPDILMHLKKREMLPAILFNFERAYCECLAKGIFKFLKEKEKAYRASTEYQIMVKKYRIGQAAAARNAALQTANPNGAQLTAADKQMEDQGVHPGDLMDPDSTFTMIGEIYTREELYQDASDLMAVNVDPELIEALRLGIGVHHAGLHKKYSLLVVLLVDLSKYRL